MAFDLDDSELAATRKMLGIDKAKVYDGKENKINMKKEEKKTSNISLGTIYDLNKQYIEKYEKELAPEDYDKVKIIYYQYLKDTSSQYYMLLCNEQKDYTLFNLLSDNAKEKSYNDLLECLNNRGKIVSFEKTKDEHAIEIWLMINNQAYCYYFFNYKKGVIEC